ncbi:putative permease [Spiroplasma helicoides]|uniref:Putative permease n=1 Tax=Spiroplasma helicoides TaxID=216938 RepID=A0A1B3SLC6_9MOLU|nr:APC family permease [Spiroplasma helicoides]AOG60735.1 putative permease [Spiroplasma helicoides]
MKTKKEELNLFHIVWIGFTFVAGITYTANFATILNQAQGQGVGLHIFWIIALVGFITFMCAWTFGKLVKVHPEANGGGSQYVRTAFGKFWGLLMGLLNYAAIPVIGVALLNTMVKANFDEVSSLTGPLKGWGDMVLDLAAFGLYIIAASVIFLGVRKYKLVSTIIGYVTWGITVLLIIFGIVGGAMNLNAGKNGLNIDRGTLDFSSFSKTFNALFFSFCGLETFITTGKNIKNREKNVPISIMIIMFMTTLFYLVFTVIVMLAVTDQFKGNPNLQLFDALNSDFLKKAGPIIIIVCTMLMRFNSSIQVTLFGGSTLEPMASQKFLPNSFKKENKENVPVTGILVTIAALAITYFMFVFVPDLIQGITGDVSVFNFSTIAGVTAIVLLFVYLLILPTAFYQGYKKNIKVNIFEYFGWVLTFICLIFIFVLYFINLIDPFVKENVDNKLQKVVASSFQMIYLFGVFVIAVLLYFVYHKKQVTKLNDKPEELKALQEYEKVFTIVNKPEQVKKSQKLET